MIKEILKEIRISALAIAVLGPIVCGAYPLLVRGLAAALFPDRAGGSMVERDGRIVGSRLIGQNFTGERYFHPRPSAAGENGYDAANSGASNLGPLSRKLIGQVEKRIAAYRAENGLPPDTQIPADAVTASASGLDPHISVRNAELQAARVARARSMSLEKIRKFIRRSTQYPQMGLLGNPAVHVFELNLALDDAQRGETDARRQGP